MGSGVPFDVYISGTNFYDSSSSEIACPTSNELSLKQITYQSEYGGIISKFNNIPYSNIDYTPITTQPVAKDVSPGSEISVLFKLQVPTPCSSGATFDTGSIYFWARPHDSSPYSPWIGIEAPINVQISN